MYQNLPSLFNLWTDKTIHVNLCKEWAMDLKKNNLYEREWYFDVLGLFVFIKKGSLFKYFKMASFT